MILEAFKLENKVALVTGASTGLGQAIAIALAEAGADVSCHGNTRSPEATCEAIIKLGRGAVSVQIGAIDHAAEIADKPWRG